jgi:hypothetical protein
MAEEPMCTIRVVRPSLLVDTLRSYKILLNGAVAGSIGHDSTLEIAAPAGAIAIEARIDWCRSNPLKISTVPGQTVEIEVRNHWGALLGLWAITLGRNSYLLLTQRPRPRKLKKPEAAPAIARWPRRMASAWTVRSCGPDAALHFQSRRSVNYGRDEVAVSRQRGRLGGSVQFCFIS